MNEKIVVPTDSYKDNLVYSEKVEYTIKKKKSHEGFEDIKHNSVVTTENNGTIENAVLLLDGVAVGVRIYEVEKDETGFITKTTFKVYKVKS